MHSNGTVGFVFDVESRSMKNEIRMGYFVVKLVVVVVELKDGEEGGEGT